MATTAIELSIRVRNISLGPDSSGARASIQSQRESDRTFVEIAQTETVFDETNISFKHRCALDYRFDRVQQVKIIVFGVKDESGLFSGELGRIKFSLSTVLANSGRLTKPLGDNSYIDVYITSPEFYSQYLRLQFCANHLHGPEDRPLATYFALVLRTETKSLLLYKSEIIKEDKKPTWNPFDIPIFPLQHYHAASLQVLVYNFNVNASDTMIGYITTTSTQLQQGAGALNSYALTNGQGVRSEKMFVDLVDVALSHGQSFLQWINTGVHLQLTVALDMTASNGNPNQPGSLHYIHPHEVSPYQALFSALVQPYLPFTANQRIGALGFGAKVGNHLHFSQAFPLSSEPDGLVCGTSGLIDAYQRTRLGIQPFAPTDYSEVIYSVSKFAKAESRMRMGLYFVLLIFTDGGLASWRRTADAIVDASTHPLSIVAIGLGNGDFANLKLMESPVLKHSDGRLIARQNFLYVHCSQLKEDDALALLPLQAAQWNHMYKNSP